MPPPIWGGGGGGGPSGPATITRSQALSVVVNDFGAEPGGLDCSAAFEAAKAALKAKLAAHPGIMGTIYWVGDGVPYFLKSRPMWLDEPFMTVASQDGTATIQTQGIGPAVVLGIREVEPVAGGMLQLMDAHATLGADYPSGGLALTLAAGTGAQFGSPTHDRPIRVLVDDGAGHRLVLGVEGRSGDVLALQDDGTGRPKHYDDGMGVDAEPVANGPDRAFAAGASVVHAHRPDLFGKLDSSACPTPGARRGIRLWGDTSLYYQGCAFTTGTKEDDNFTWGNWGNVSTFAIEFLVESADGGPFRSSPGPICNLGNGGDLRPFAVASGATNIFSLTFATADGASHQIKCTPGPTAAGPIGICFQLSLGSSKSVQAYVRNPDGTGTQVAVDVAADGPFWASTTPTTFRRNDYAGLLFARQYNDLRCPSQTNGWVSQDFTLAGFLVGAGRRYKDRGVGLAQQRLDDGVVNDNYRYFNGSPAFSDPAVVAYVAMSDPPSVDRRVTTVVFESRRCCGYLLHGAMNSYLGGQKDTALRGLRLRGEGTSPVVQLGAFLNHTIEDCDVDGGTQAIGSLNLLASYPLAVRRCRLGGSESVIYAAWLTLLAEFVEFVTNGRVPIRIWAANATVKDAFVDNFGTAHTESIIKCHGGGYGGMYEFTGGFVDAESTVLTGEGFLLEPIVGIPVTTVRIQDWYMGTMGAAPLVRARAAGTDPSCRIALDVGLIQCDTDGFALDVDSARIAGRMSDVHTCRGGASTRSGGYAGPVNVTLTNVGT
jgi:hypothetical protein